ncbi:MAG: phage holin family protein [Anaerolineae bacterium]|nr:phage holin family protein [Anaerolineae bacterium]NIN95028.1 phage holin family protein [Anaerolineae bacterium]NIQ78067.1 phage holin family protein [Anaerolineae bacterium]
MVRRILLRLLINAVALWVAVMIVPGIYAENPFTILVVALIFGVVNALIRPLVAFFTCPMIILTLGLFIFVINALMLWFTAWVAGQFDLGFAVTGFWAAFWGALVISLVSFGISLLIKDE